MVMNSIWTTNTNWEQEEIQLADKYLRKYTKKIKNKYEYYMMITLFQLFLYPFSCTLIPFFHIRNQLELVTKNKFELSKIAAPGLFEPVNIVFS